MKRLLELTSAELRTGVARSQYDDKGGAWQSAIGLNPFLSDDTSRFLLATTATPTRLGTNDFTDIPIAYAVAPTASASIMYILGSSGRFYSLNSSNTDSVIIPQATVILGTIANPTGGMIPVTDSGGNNYLFIGARQTLVRWDLNTADSLTHWNTSNGLFSCNHHPMHRLFDQVYFGNSQYLGQIPLSALHNQATTLTNINFQLIDFRADVQVTALGDDGRYLLAAMSRNFDETINITTDARVIWYPNVGINWDWEVTLKGERAVRAIVRTAIGVFAIGEQTIYQLAFGQQPKLVKTFDTADSPGGAFNVIAQSAGPRVNLARPFGDSLIFGKRGAVFGKRFPTEPITFSHPLQGHTSDISMIVPDFIKTKIYVGTEDSKFWVYDMATAGNTSNTYTTRWFDLKQRSEIKRIEIDMPASIAASDSTVLTVTTPSGSSASITLSQAVIATPRRTYAQIQLKPTLQASQVKLSLAPSAGAPKLSAIYLYGDPTVE